MLGISSLTVTCWFALAPVVELDIVEDDELLNTYLLAAICCMVGMYVLRSRGAVSVLFSLSLCSSFVHKTLFGFSRLSFMFNGQV